MTITNDLPNKIKGKVLQFSRSQSAEFFYKRAVQKYTNNNFVDTVMYFRKGIEADPLYIDNIISLCETLSQMGLFEKSNRLILSYFPDLSTAPSDVIFGLGCNFLSLNCAESAKKYLTDYVTRFPDDCYTEEAYDILDMLEENEDYDELDSTDAFSDNFVDKQSNVTTLTMLVNDSQDLDFNNIDSVIAFYKLAIEQNPGLNFLYSNLALAYYCANDYKNAITAITKYLEYNPDDISARCSLAMYCNAIHDEAAVKREIELLKKCKTDDIDALNHIAIAFMELRMYEDALSPARKIAYEMPYTKSVNHRLAMCYYMTGDYKKALSIYDKFIRLDSTDSIARFYIDVCKDAINGKKVLDTPLTNYDVPPAEALSRISYLRKVLTDMSKPNPDSLYDDPLLYLYIKWALLLHDPNLKRILLISLSLFECKRSEMLLRDFLLRSGNSDDSIETAVISLRAIGAKEPYAIYTPAGFVFETRSSLLDRMSTVSRTYFNILAVMMERMGKLRNDEICLKAISSFQQYVRLATEKDKTVQKLSRNQIIAMAAAFDFIICVENNENVTQTAICEQYDLTTLRFSNALRRVFTTFNPDSPANSNDFNVSDILDGKEEK